MGREVARARRKPYTRKERVGITPDPQLMAWILERMGPGKRFANLTHAFESGIVCLMEQDKRSERAPPKRSE